MASIRERVNKAGVTSYAVLFTHEGKQRSRTFTARRAAEKFRKLIEGFDNPADALRMLDAGVPHDGPTVADLFDEWLEVKRADMTTEGHKDYVRQYERWIKPTFGWRDASLVTERDVQA